MHGYICALIILLLARYCFFLVIIKSLTCESPSVQRSLNLFMDCIPLQVAYSIILAFVHVGFEPYLIYS